MKYEIDAGHGGNDPGATGARQLPESRVTLDVAKIVGRHLVSQGHEVLFTRTTNVFVDLNERSNKANRDNVGYFVSIHENSCDTPEVNGTETYCFNKGGKAEILAIAVQTELVAELKLNNRGVKTANFAVLRQTNMPAILIESSFISNKDEEIRLMDVDYKERIALSIAKGIVKGSGQVWKDPIIEKKVDNMSILDFQKFFNTFNVTGYAKLVEDGQDGPKTQAAKAKLKIILNYILG